MAVLGLLMQSMMHKWALYLIGLQAALAVFGVLVLIGLSLWRKNKTEKDAEFIPMIQERLTNVACGLDEDFSDIKSMPKIFMHKTKSVLLPMISSLQGDSRRRLCKIYKEFNFHLEDYKNLRSSNFALRLGAIARLEIVDDDTAVEVVRPLLRDESPYVHFAAVRYMLKMDDTFHPRIDAEMYLAEVMHRYDAAREILNCYIRNHRKEFINLYEQTLNRKMAEVCLEIIQKNRMVDALPVVLDKLIEALRSEGYDGYTEFDFKRVTQCLTISPSDEVEGILERMTYMEDSYVRACGYRALFKVRPDLKFELVDRLSQDESPSIQRLYSEVRDELAALGGAA